MDRVFGFYFVFKDDFSTKSCSSDIRISLLFLDSIAKNNCNVSLCSGVKPICKILPSSVCWINAIFPTSTVSNIAIIKLISVTDTLPCWSYTPF